MTKRLYPNALKLIINNVESLLQENIDETPTRSFWPSDKFFDADRCIQSKEEFETSCKSLQRLKGFQRALMSVTSILTEKIKNMQDVILPASCHHGFKSLPDDIFMRILDILAAECMGADCTSTGRTPAKSNPEKGAIGFIETRSLTKKLMTVSRRFREGVVSNVSFWKGLDKEFCQNKGLETRLSRSKNAPLSLGVRFTGSQEMIDFLSKALPFKDRLEHIQIKIRSKPTDVTRLFSAIEFPSVVSLRIWTSDAPGNVEFLKRWTFPRLRKLECTCYAPPPGIFSGLTELRLSSAGGIFSRSGLYITRLIELLRSIDNLQSLSLDVTRIDIPMGVNDRIIPVELSSVLYFAITNSTDTPAGRNQDKSVLALGQVLRAVNMPNVESMALSIQFNAQDFTHHHHGLWGLLGRSVIYRSKLYYPSVKTLSLTSTCLGPGPNMPQAIPNLDLTFVLKTFPNLHKLDVDVPDFTLCLTSYISVENLRSLEIKENQLTSYGAHISNLFEGLRARGTKLEEIIIWTMYHINLERIYKVYPDVNIQIRLLC